MWCYIKNTAHLHNKVSYGKKKKTSNMAEIPYRVRESDGSPNMVKHLLYVPDMHIPHTFLIGIILHNYFYFFFHFANPLNL